MSIQLINEMSGDDMLLQIENKLYSYQIFIRYVIITVLGKHI